MLSILQRQQKLSLGPRKCEGRQTIHPSQRIESLLDLLKPPTLYELIHLVISASLIVYHRYKRATGGTQYDYQKAICMQILV